jgi:hypothetical protein
MREEIEEWFECGEFLGDQLGVEVIAGRAYIVGLAERLGQAERNQRDELRRAV